MLRPALQQGSADWDAWVDSNLRSLEQQHLLRRLRPMDAMNSSTQASVRPLDLDAWLADEDAPGWTSHPPPPGRSTMLKLFSLNDYLGLASHPAVCRAAAEAALSVGMGARSSALVAGYSHMHRELEGELASLKGTEDCLLLPCGFSANLAAVSVLGSAAPSSSTLAASSASLSASTVQIFSDELNHASIIDGARLATRGGSTGLQVYRHNDLAHLDQLLAAAPAGCRKLVVSDSLFSMDGDYADVAGLVEVKRRHGALLVLDEAHATLVVGEHGGGAAEAAGVAHEVDVHVGTLSKAFGAVGGFVACSRGVKSLLANRGRSFVYSTALPLPVVAAAQAALRVSQRECWRRRHLDTLSHQLAAGLGVAHQSHILPLVVGSEAAALRLASRLLRNGFHVPAIRPPTVAPGACRLRVCLTAAHTAGDVAELVGALRDVGALEAAAASASLPVIDNKGSSVRCSRL